MYPPIESRTLFHVVGVSGQSAENSIHFYSAVLKYFSAMRVTLCVLVLLALIALAYSNLGKDLIKKRKGKKWKNGNTNQGKEYQDQDNDTEDEKDEEEDHHDDSKTFLKCVHGRAGSSVSAQKLPSSICETDMEETCLTLNIANTSMDDRYNNSATLYTCGKHALRCKSSAIKQWLEKAPKGSTCEECNNNEKFNGCNAPDIYRQIIEERQGKE